MLGCCCFFAANWLNMSISIRTCIFCGPSCGRLTKEDVWPTWLGQYIPKSGTSYSASSTVIHDDRPADVIRKTINGDSKSRRVKLVCSNCNNGWMSRLQRRAKPVVLPLAMGQSTLIGVDAQRTLAAWCAMSVMTSDHFYPDRAAIPQQHRDALMRLDAPPADQWKIWIGHYERGDWVADWVQNALAISSDAHLARNLPDGVPIPNTQTTTLVFGNLYVHAVSSVHPDIIEMVGSPSGKLVRLFPLGDTAIEWPQKSLTDRDADDAAGFIVNALANAT